MNLSTSLSTRVSTSPTGGAMPGGHLFIFNQAEMNEIVHHPTVHYLSGVASGQARGHLKPAEIRQSCPLSTIFLLKSKKRRIERKVALDKEYARVGGHRGQALIPQRITA